MSGETKGRDPRPDRRPSVLRASPLFVWKSLITSSAPGYKEEQWKKFVLEQTGERQECGPELNNDKELIGGFLLLRSRRRRKHRSEKRWVRFLHDQQRSPLLTSLPFLFYRNLYFIFVDLLQIIFSFFPQNHCEWWVFSRNFPWNRAQKLGTGPRFSLA